MGRDILTVIPPCTTRSGRDGCGWSKLDGEGGTGRCGSDAPEGEGPVPERRGTTGARQGGPRAPLSSHTGWTPAADRPDPVALLEEQNATREPDLVPVRHGRMLVSPFTFYRGAAKIMAADLEGTRGPVYRPTLRGRAPVELRRVRLAGAGLLFDLNDFDETLPGPFEYDVKRMAASFAIAARNNGFTKADTGRDPGRGAGLPGGHGAVRADAHDGHLVRPPVRGAADGGHRPGRGQPEGQGAQEQAQGEREDGTEERREGPHPRQPAGPVEARRGGRRRVPDRQPATDRDPGPGARRRPTGMSADEVERRGARPVPAYRATLRTTAGTCSSASRSSTWPKRSWVSAASAPGRSSSCSRVATAGPVVPAGQGGHHLGAGGPSAQEPLPAARRAGGSGAADDAGRQRHLPGLDQGRAGQPLPVLAAAARHEGLRDVES